MTRRPAAAIVFVALVAACGGKPAVTTSAVASRSADLATKAVLRIGTSYETLSAIPAFTNLSSTLGGVTPLVGSAGGTAPVPLVRTPADVNALLSPSRFTELSGATSGATQNPLRSAIAWAVSGPTSLSTTDQAAADVEKFLKERVFIDANLESSDATSATYLLHGDRICTDGTYPADPQCVSQVDQIQIRIRATPRGDDSIDLTIIIGPLRSETITLKLTPSSAALDFDLGGIKTALQHIETITGTNLDLPRVMQGVAEVKVEENAPQDATLSLSVLQAIGIEVDTASGTTTFQTAVKQPLVSLRAEAAIPRATLSLDLGPTVVSAPYTGGVAGQQVTVDLAGASYTLVGQGTDPSIDISNIGLGDGPTTVSLDTTVIFRTELNPQLGHRFAFHEFKDPVDGYDTFEFTPGVDLGATFYLQPLTVDRTIDSYLLDETFHVSLIGTTRGVLKYIPATTDPVTSATTPAATKVVEGTLTLSTTEPGISPVTVSAGECLTSVPNSSGLHPLQQIQVTACP